MGETVRRNAAPQDRSLFSFELVRRHLGEYRRYRYLLGILVVRELKARYRSSALGYLWTLLNPVMLLAVYSLVFSIVMRIKVDDYPYFLFVGLLPWLWLSGSLTVASTCIVHEGGKLLKRVLLPPQLLPATHVGAHMVNMLLALPVLLAAGWWFGRMPPLSVLWFYPVIVLAQLGLTVGLAAFVAALCVRFRDTEFLVGNVVNLWFYLTPICYPLSLVPENYRYLVHLNPIYPLASAYQDLFYHGRSPEATTLGCALAIGVVGFWVGARLFEAMRDDIVENV